MRSKKISTQTYATPGADNNARSGRKRRVHSKPGERGFTFVEILAALLFTAIVVPVALQGITLAHRAGVLAEHKVTTLRLADAHMNELIVTQAWKRGLREGTFGEEWPGYQWSLDESVWMEDNMRMLTLRVTYHSQGQTYWESLSTLVDDSQS